MYTDDTILTFGRYKFYKLCNVPEEYLLKFYDSNFDSKDSKHQELIEYIQANRERITNNLPKPKTEPKLDDKISHRVLGTFVKLVCNFSNKIIYASEKDAKFEISRIRGISQDNKKPIRAYECKECGGWHTTSAQHKKWDENSNQI